MVQNLSNNIQSSFNSDRLFSFALLGRCFGGSRGLLLFLLPLLLGLLLGAKDLRGTSLGQFGMGRLVVAHQLANRNERFATVLKNKMALGFMQNIKQISPWKWW